MSLNLTIPGVANYCPVEVIISQPDRFLIIKETLTRIGIPSKDQQVLTQSCHILHKQGQYYIMHFKELFALDGRPTSLNENDVLRRNLIANLLEQWGLVEIVNRECTNDEADISSIKILSSAETEQWNLASKYTIGQGRRKPSK